MDHVADVDSDWGENKFVIEFFSKLIEKRGVQSQFFEIIIIIS